MFNFNEFENYFLELLKIKFLSEKNNRNLLFIYYSCSFVQFIYNKSIQKRIKNNRME